MTGRIVSIAEELAATTASAIIIASTATAVSAATVSRGITADCIVLLIIDSTHTFEIES